MTLETRHVIDLSDLESLSLRCANCQTTVTWGVDANRKVLLNCPSCLRPMCPDPSDIRAGIVRLIEGIQEVRHALRQPGCPATLQINLTATTVSHRPE